MSRSIRVAADTYAALETLKVEDETFDELVSRLIRDRRNGVREEAGLWNGTAAADRARAAREELKQNDRSG